jgi:hypothetical protein
MKRRYDVEFQLEGFTVWFRVNDNVAESEEEAVELAYQSLKKQVGIDAMEHEHSVEILNEEKV